VTFSLKPTRSRPVMLVTVTFVGTLIAVFSAGLHARDPGYPAILRGESLFCSPMTWWSSRQFPVLYTFWEGRRLCSYLLIGFWFPETDAAAAARRRPFLVHDARRCGSFRNHACSGSQFGNSSEFGRFPEPRIANGQSLHDRRVLLLFCGALGRQIVPSFHCTSGFPDAMKGPSPVSALIPPQRWVTAGVLIILVGSHCHAAVCP